MSTGRKVAPHDQDQVVHSNQPFIYVLWIRTWHQIEMLPWFVSVKVVSLEEQSITSPLFIHYLERQMIFFFNSTVSKQFEEDCFTHL